MSLIQKAVTPQLSNAYLTAGWDRVSGFVVEASTVAFATTPAQLFDVHALGFPGSPFSPDDPNCRRVGRSHGFWPIRARHRVR
jgi:hypothetical protein